MEALHTRGDNVTSICFQTNAAVRDRYTPIDGDQNHHHDVLQVYTPRSHGPGGATKCYVHATELCMHQRGSVSSGRVSCTDNENTLKECMSSGVYTSSFPCGIHVDSIHVDGIHVDSSLSCSTHHVTHATDSQLVSLSNTMNNTDFPCGKHVDSSLHSYTHATDLQRVSHAMSNTDFHSERFSRGMNQSNSPTDFWSVQDSQIVRSESFFSTESTTSKVSQQPTDISLWRPGTYEHRVVASRESVAALSEQQVASCLGYKASEFESEMELEIVQIEPESELMMVGTWLYAHEQWLQATLSLKKTLTSSDVSYWL
jgi:hypothetical protein